MLRAVDIASHQAGIDVTALDCDIVIIKVSGGTSYANPYWREWADAALASGKLLALYHYACEYDSEPGGRAEAEYFWHECKEYKGRFVPILDWENHACSMPVSYAKAFLDRIAELSGATPFFYGYASNVNSSDYSSISGYPLWMASYLSRYEGAGWCDPDNTWGTGDWQGMLMYQYTSTGYIDGWPNRLDLSVFYGGTSDWIKLEGGHMGSIEKMVQHAIDIANNDWYGYSWADRWNHDRDCASLMYDSADAAGYSVGRGPDKTRYTGTMIDDFTAAGFTCHDFGSVILQRGDILLRKPWSSDEGHTEMYIGNSQCVGAHSSETGGVYGEPGDQTGNEISITAMWGSWDYVLRPPEGSSMMGTWIEDNGRWWYKHADGSYTKDDWEWINDRWYYFDSEGWMYTGWLAWKGYWYYLQPKTKETGNDYGYMVTGWQKIKWRKVTSWFWFDDSGALYMDGFARISGKWYAFDANGRMVENVESLSVSKDGDITIK